MTEQNKLCNKEIHAYQNENETYDKIFYVNYDKFNKKLEERKYLCNENCHYYRKDILCDKFEICGRAYQIGQQTKE